MIQVIPFIADNDPVFLPLLARGLSDLSALRFNALSIQAQINTELEINCPDDEQVEPHINREGQELWFSGKIQGNHDLAMSMYLYDPTLDKMVYRDTFQVSEERFLVEWEQHLNELIQYLGTKNEIIPDINRGMYTRSLDAFLAFRRGLETLSQAKNDRIREEGMESLLNAVAFDPEFMEAADILLLFLMQNDISRNFERSVSILERLRLVADRHPRVPLVLAEVYYQWGNLEKTESLLQEVVAAFQQFTEGWIRLALFYHSVDRLDQALVALHKILEYEPDEMTAMDLMGAIYAGQGERDKAEEVWQRVLELEPSRVNILNNLALLSEEKEDFQQAEFFYRRAIQTNENWWGSFYHYGAFCWRRQRYDEAAGLLERAVMLNPTHYPSFQTLGLTLIQLGRYREAQEAFIQLLRLAPDNSLRRQTLQWLDYYNEPRTKMEIELRDLEKDWTSGKRWLVYRRMFRIYRQAKEHWYYWYLLGEIAIGFKLERVALFCWTRGFKYDPGYPLLKRYGLFLWKKEQYTKALPWLRQAYRRHKNDPEVTRAYVQVLVELKETDELPEDEQLKG